MTGNNSKSHKWATIASLILWIFIILFSQTCKPRETIKIDGSSTVFELSEAIVEEYNKDYREIFITIGISGTGGGFKKICNKELDLVNASRRIKANEQASCAKNGIELIEFPIAADGITIAVNNDNTFFHTASVQDLKRIFASATDAPKTWSELNSNYPKKTIKIYSPGHDSGTFDYFKDVVLGQQTEMRNDLSFSEDDNFLIRGIVDDQFSIGFFGVSYYNQNKDFLKAVAIISPKDNKPYLPTLNAVSQKTYHPLSRDLFIYANIQSIKEKVNVQKFIKYYLENAKRMSIEVETVPLSEKMYSKNLKTFSTKFE